MKKLMNAFVNVLDGDMEGQMYASMDETRRSKNQINKLLFFLLKPVLDSVH